MSTHPTPIRILGKDATASTASVVAAHMPSARLLLVCDDNTWATAGESVHALLSTNTAVRVQSLGTHVRPRRALAEEIAAYAAPMDGLIAVGSGTINDLTKYAAATANKPYGVIATAATMNGYTAANASLEEDGHKQSLPAHPPVFVLGDTTTLMNAPKRLMRAGLGDTLCRTTVEADMLLSHWLLGTPYSREIFDALRRHEPALLTGTMNARDGEEAFITTLFTALLDAGDAMTTHGSSAPASQGEHMIAHTLELKYGDELHDVMHGELIAITSVTMSHLQHRMLLALPSVKPMAYGHEQYERLFGKQHGPMLAALYQKKLLNTERAHTINAIIGQHWPEIKQALSEIMLPTNTLERALIHSGMHTQPTQINLAEERYRFATSYAHLTRDRFTFLDLAAMNAKRVA
jgi:glycerol-1-phosphate dehydrogenase [NAD(P)+]